MPKAAISRNVRRPLRGPLLDAISSSNDGLPRYQTIYRSLRASILGGTLKAGTRLPSTRTFAADLHVSRKTAEEAYAQLEREGFVERRTGSGTYVADVPAPARKVRVRLEGDRRMAIRSRAAMDAVSCVEPQVVRPFAAGLPALDAFPVDLWRRLVALHARRLDANEMIYGDPAGYAPLREAVASYLVASRGVNCDASQVIIVNSSQQALDLAARMLLDPGDEAWIEDPGYYGARAAFLSAGARVVPVPVDAEGLDVAAGVALAPRARVAYVTPSNQYPLGTTMSLERRLALLEWTRRANAWIVEDDYDGEFRYDGRPLAAIQGLDTTGRVLYAGTFTKSLYPSLRLAYLVVPPDLVDPFVRARTQLDGHPATFMQAVVADFLAGGHFGAHVRRMRALYHSRRDILLAALRRLRVDVAGSDAGLRLSVFIHGSDRRASERAARAGLDVPPLSRLYCGASPRNGLVLGYAALSPSAIRAGVLTLQRFV
jgi:GntR family transcriptional regulator/MocR family aminotransferase